MATITTQIAQVAQFMKVAGQAVNTKPTAVSLGVAKLRYNLIIEEITGKNEFQYCAERDDVVGMLDGLCDILYVVYGAALTFGVDISSDNEAPSVANSRLASAFDSIESFKYMTSNAEKFKKAYEEDNYNEIRSVLAAITFLVYKYAKKINVDLAGAFDEVHKSNMSKFSETKEHAEASVAARQAGGDEKYNDVYVTSVEVEGTEYWMIKRNEDHKILKSLNFFEPDLSKFV